jgi:hypothetical protein
MGSHGMKMDKRPTVIPEALNRDVETVNRG